MDVYLAIFKKEALSKEIKYKRKNINIKIVYTTLKSLRRSIIKKHSNLKGWYYIKINSKKDKFSISEESSNKKDEIYIDLPFTIKLSNKDIRPLYIDNKIGKRIPGFSRYMASNEGDILSIKTGNFTKGVTAGHYLKVSLIKDGSRKSKMEYVHRLICRTFHGVQPGKNYVVMHKDDNKENNRATNLKWGTQSENITDVWKQRKKQGITMENIVNKMETNIKDIDNVSEFVTTLSVENGFINGINSSIIKRIKKMVGTYNDKIDIIKVISSDDGKNLKELKTNYINIKRNAIDVKFNKVDSRLCPVTLGLKASLVEVTTILNKNHTLLNKVLIPSLEVLSLNVSKILSDVDFRKSFKPKKHNYDEIRTVTRTVRNNLREVIDPDSNVDRVKVSRLIPNISCIPKLLEDTAKVGNDLDKVDMNEIANLINNIKEKIDVLHEYMDDVKTDFVVTKDTISAVTEGLDVNAELVTVAMSNYMLANNQIGMVNNLIEIIEM